MVRKKTLTEDLRELEQTNPEVREAAHRYNENVADILYHARLDRYREHRAGQCDPENCEYVHK